MRFRRLPVKEGFPSASITRQGCSPSSSQRDRSETYQTAKTSDTKRFAQFFIEMMNQGIYLPPSQFEAWFISLAHTQKDLDRTLEACEGAFKKI